MMIQLTHSLRGIFNAQPLVKHVGSELRAGAQATMSKDINMQ